MDEAVRAYVDAIGAEHRPLFDRVHGLVVAAHPEVTITLSYGMPTYRVGPRRLYLGAWKHGVSLYGWDQGAADPFLGRHPELRSGKGTVRLQAADAAELGDDELLELIGAALGG